MPKRKPRIIVILGQTATGKSDLAVKLARKFQGEIISADSRQVYKGLDIGTGKITRREMRGVPHHLLDIVSPRRQFSVSDYKKLAEQKITEILKKNKMPIIVGGTGFYIQAITDNIILPQVPPNRLLRKKLSALNADKLFKILNRLDSKRTKNIDAKNKIRLIRAIEIAKALGKVPSVKDGPCQYEILKIGTKFPDPILKVRIHKRLLARIKQGMIEEARNLHRRGISWRCMKELGLEYRYLALYLENKMTKQEMVRELEKAIWQYAKRQWTWFKRDKRIKWFNPAKPSDLKKIEQEIGVWIK